MSLIYKPSGAALEYAEYALNIYTGCEHQCLYCYAPSAILKKREDYYSGAHVKKDFLNRLEKDAQEASRKGINKEILVCFVGDPYQPAELKLSLTRRTVETLINYNLPFTILTKGGLRAVRDFNLLENYNKCRFGISIVFTDQANANYWEPGAATIAERIETIKEAHSRGIATWISLEPVIDPKQALDLIHMLHPYVGQWKVGKINHNKKVEDTVDWIRFRDDVTALLDSIRANYYIKDSLRKL